MDEKKAAERQALVQVFGNGPASTARDFERPDFLLPTDDGLALGVEITSVYANNADAKLRNFSGYTMGLLEQTQRLHRADQPFIKVDEATLLDEHGNEEGKFFAIIQKLPTLKDSFNLLLAQIDEKNNKASDYLRHCDCVDLIVVDGSQVFFHKKTDDFYHAFLAHLPRETFTQSLFREIYLVTRNEHQQEVFMPLIASRFIADCFAYNHLIEEKSAAHSDKEMAQLLTACLYASGYARAKVAIHDEGIGFLYGSCELHYTESQCTIREWMVPPKVYPGEELSMAIANSPQAVLSQAQEFVACREDIFSYVPLQLPLRTG